MRIPVGVSVLAAVYVWRIRPWHLRWGATDVEVRSVMQHIKQLAERSAAYAGDASAAPLAP